MADDDADARVGQCGDVKTHPIRYGKLGNFGGKAKKVSRMQNVTVAGPFPKT